MFDLNVLCEASNDAVLSEFSDQNIQKLKSEVNNSTMDYKTKQKLLKKINAISKVNKQALKLIESGQKKKADRKINLEYEKLYQFQKYVEKKKGTSIENSTADDLLNITNTMIQGHSNGAKWILDNNQNMTFNQTNDYYDNIKSKVSEIKGIIKELKAQGVPISVETVDVESLNSSNNNNNNNNKTSKGTVKVKAAAQALVIIVGGVAIILAAMAIAAIETEGFIEDMRKSGKPVCGRCETYMLVINMASAGLCALAVIGISMVCIEAVAFLEYALGIIEYNDLVLMIPSAALSAMIFNAKKVVIPCDTPPELCVFSGYRLSDLKGKIEAPENVYLHQNVNFNVTIFNDFMGNASDFKVTLYEKFYNNANQLINSTVIGYQSVSFLQAYSNTTLNFDWTAYSPAIHYFSIMIDPDYVVNETDDANNYATNSVNVIALPDLIPKLESPQDIYIHSQSTVNAEIMNNEPMIAGPFEVTLYENSTSADENGNMNFTPITTQTIDGMLPNSTKLVSFNWTPNTYGEHVLKIVADSQSSILELNESNNGNSVTVDVKKEKMHLYNTEHFQSSSNPNADRAIAYYYEASEPVYLNPGARTPTFVINTTTPEYSPVGFQAWYPYGAIWLSFSNSPDGPWTSAFTNPYVYCGENTTEYQVDHWAIGSGNYKYFRLYIRTQPINWGSGVIKTFITGFDVK